MEADTTDNPESSKKQKWENWKTFFWFLAFSILAIWVLLTQQLSFEKWQHWLILGGVVFFPVMAAISFFTAYRNWSPEKSDQVTTRTWAWLIGGPIVLVVGVWSAVSIFGWLGSIPSWAAVVIVLLVLILLKR